MEEAVRFGTYPSGAIRRAHNKIMPDLHRLESAVNIQRSLGKTVVVTIGSYDWLHEGHVRYLMQASEFADVLVVGTDSDDAMKIYKDPTRPLVAQQERMEMLSYIECVDYVTLLEDVYPQEIEGKIQGVWHYELLRRVKPDVFVAVENSYPDYQLREIELLVGKNGLVVLPPQGKFSTTERLRQAMMKHKQKEELNTAPAAESPDSSTAQGSLEESGSLVSTVIGGENGTRADGVHSGGA